MFLDSSRVSEHSSTTHTQLTNQDNLNNENQSINDPRIPPNKFPSNNPVFCPCHKQQPNTSPNRDIRTSMPPLKARP